MFKTFRKFLRSSFGNTTMMFAFALVPLLGATGAAVDMVRANHVRTVLQAAADEAALAGSVSGTTTQAQFQTIVMNYLTANKALQELEGTPIVTAGPNTTTKRYVVTVDGKMKTGFMGVLGFNLMDLGVRSEVSLGSQVLEMVMVLDNTGSMAGTKMTNLKSAAKNLVDIIAKEKSDYADVKIAVVPFAEYVNVGKANANQGWLKISLLDKLLWGGCVGSRVSPLDEKAGATGGTFSLLLGNTSLIPSAMYVPCNVEVQPLTNDFTKVRTKIDSMTAVGATYIPTGLLWGWNVIDAQAPYTEGKTKAQMTAAEGKKVIVLMTDGENTISPIGSLHTGADVAKANSKLTNVCNGVKSDGVEMYTVSFMVSTTTIEDLLKNCASSGKNYFNADSPSDLYAAFTKIGQDLSGVRLTN